MTKGDYLDSILRSQKTIFSVKDASLLWRESNLSTVRRRLKGYVNTGKLIRVHRGFYAKDEHYNVFELATSIYNPSYVSFETVLTEEGLNFQYYSTIFIASYLSREIEIKGKKIKYIRIKDHVLVNSSGVKNGETYSIATKERAFLDRIYISKKYHIDNPDSLNWDTIFTLLPIYNNASMEKYIKKYHSTHIF